MSDNNEPDLHAELEQAEQEMLVKVCAYDALLKKINPDNTRKSLPSTSSFDGFQVPGEDPVTLDHAQYDEMFTALESLHALRNSLEEYVSKKARDNFSECLNYSAFDFSWIGKLAAERINQLFDKGE